MNIDRRTLSLAAPVLSTVGSLVAFVAAVRRRPRSAGNVMSSLLGLVGSAAWAAAAWQESLEPDVTVVTAD